MIDIVNLRAQPTTALLRMYASILVELRRREVTRSQNAPAGDLAELLVERAYNGALAPNSEKSWDVLAADGRKLQVKCRVLPSLSKRSSTFSPFRSWGFDDCIFVMFDAATYRVLRAVLLSVTDVQAIAAEVSWVAGFRVNVGQVLRAGDATVGSDVTQALQAEVDMLDAEPPETTGVGDSR